MPNLITQQEKRVDNRILSPLAEYHPSRIHHAHTVKAALTKQLDLEVGSRRTFQKVKNGLAIVLNNLKEVEIILSKASTIAATLGETLEKAEK